MSDLILQWLNDEVQLSRKVTNFEEDFHNGYLIGEILHKYNQQLNFKEFKDDENREFKIKNFRLIFPTLKCLKVSFDSKVCDKIIAKEKDVAKNILYQIKMALEKVHNPADKLLMTQKQQGLQSINPQKKIKIRKEQYETMESDFFKQMLDKGQRSQMLINQERHLEKFNLFKEKQDLLIEECKRKEREEEQKVKEEIRKIQLDKLQRNQNFMEDWQKKGLDNWRGNRKKQKQREEEEKDFKEKDQKNRKEKTLLLQTIQRKEVLEELEEFEGKINQQSQLQQEQLEEEQGQQQLQSSNKYMNNNELTATQTLNKLKEQKLISEFQKKERDKRRRKMIVDQARNQKQFEVRQREEQILSKLNRRSKQELELQYEEWRCLQSYDLILQSRELREEKYKQRKELMQLNSKYKEEEMLNQLQLEYHHQLQGLAKNQKKLEIKYKQEGRRENYNLCSDILEAIFEIQDCIFWHMQDNDIPSLEEVTILDYTFILFLNDQPQLKRINRGESLSTHHLNNQTQLQLISNHQYYFYLNHPYQQLLNNPFIFKLTDILHTLLLQQNQHNQYLNKHSQIQNQQQDQLQIQKQILEITISNQQQQQNIQDQQLLPLILCVIGNDYSGKIDYSQQLAKKLNYQVVEVSNILNEIANKFQTSMSNNYNILNNSNMNNNINSNINSNVNIKLNSNQNINNNNIIANSNNNSLNKIISNNLSQSNLYDENIQILEKLFKGQKLEDKEIVQLIVRHIESNKQQQKGFVILDFPQNINQFNLIQKVMKEQQQQISVMIESMDKVEQEMRISIILEREKKKEKQRMKESLIDLVILIEREDKECIRQQLGRLKDTRNNAEYHLDSNKPQTDNYPTLENLVKIDSIENNEGIIVNRIEGFKQELIKMKPILMEYGYEEQQLRLLQQVSSFEQMESVVNDILELRELKYQEKIEEREKIRLQREEEITVINKSIEDSKKFTLTDNDTINQHIQQLLTMQHSLPIQSVNHILQILYHTDQAYQSTIKQSFINMHLQKQFISYYLSELQRKFIQQLQLEDDKTIKLIQFQKDYNHFLDTNKDMIMEDQTKEEMHMRVFDLEQYMWELAENKKVLMLQQKQTIQEEQFMEKQQEKYLNIVTEMVISEMFRHQMVNLVISDYYALIQGKEGKETLKDNLRKINTTLISEIPIEDPDLGFVRLNKLFEEALKRISAQEEEELKQQQDQNNKNVKGKTVPVKKEEKKEKIQVQVQDQEGVNELDKERDNILEVEYNIYSSRLKYLQREAEKELGRMKQQNQQVMNKLEDWVEYCNQVENRLIECLSEILRDYIEQERKIQTEISIANFTIIQSSQTLNYLTPPPLILPAIEKQAQDRFTISQLYLMIEDIKLLSYSDNLIDNNSLLNYMLNKTNLINYPDLPAFLHSLNKSSVMKLINNLDQNYTGTVNIKHLLTYLSLLNTPILKLNDYLQYEQLMLSISDDKLTLTQDQFTQLDAFFDVYESEPCQIENQRTFQRQKLVKELIFYILKDSQKETLNIQEYLEILNCEQYIKSDQEKEKIKTYKNLLFS